MPFQCMGKLTRRRTRNNKRTAVAFDTDSTSASSTEVMLSPVIDIVVADPVVEHKPVEAKVEIVSVPEVIEPIAEPVEPCVTVEEKSVEEEVCALEEEEESIYNLVEAAEKHATMVHVDIPFVRMDEISEEEPVIEQERVEAVVGVPSSRVEESEESIYNLVESVESAEKHFQAVMAHVAAWAACVEVPAAETPEPACVEVEDVAETVLESEVVEEKEIEVCDDMVSVVSDSPCESVNLEDCDECVDCIDADMDDIDEGVMAHFPMPNMSFPREMFAVQLPELPRVQPCVIAETAFTAPRLAMPRPTIAMELGESSPIMMPNLDIPVVVPSERVNVGGLSPPSLPVVQILHDEDEVPAMPLMPPSLSSGPCWPTLDEDAEYEGFTRMLSVPRLPLDPMPKVAVAPLSTPMSRPSLSMPSVDMTPVSITRTLSCPTTRFEEYSVDMFTAPTLNSSAFFPQTPKPITRGVSSTIMPPAGLVLPQPWLF